MKNLIESYWQLQMISFHWDQPIEWASGILSPVYCDHRRLLGDPVWWKMWVSALGESLYCHYPEVEIVSAVAMAGIPHAVALSMECSLPLCYVRKEAKRHGKGKQIEGGFSCMRGRKSVVVEDLISSGGSSLHVVEILREQGVDVLGVLSLFSYELPSARNRFKEMNVTAHSVVTLKDIMNVALQEERITKEEYEKLLIWKDSH